MPQAQCLVKDGVETWRYALWNSPADLHVILINKSMVEEQLCFIDELAPGTGGSGQSKGQNYPREVKLHL